MKRKLTWWQMFIVSIVVYLLSKVVPYPINAVFELVGLIAFIIALIGLVRSFFKKKDKNK